MTNFLRNPSTRGGGAYKDGPENIFFAKVDGDTFDDFQDGPGLIIQGGRLQGLARGQARNHFFAKMDRPGQDRRHFFGDFQDWPENVLGFSIFIHF